MEGWAASGASETALEHQQPPSLLVPLSPLTRPFRRSHSTGMDLCRWRELTQYCHVGAGLGAVSRRLSSKIGQTLAERHNDTSEKWAPIAYTASQPGLSHVHQVPTP